LQWFSLPFHDFKILSNDFNSMLWVYLIFGAKTSSNTDKRVKLIEPVKQKERRGGHWAITGPLAWSGPSAIGGPPAMEWALASGGPTAFDGPPAFDRPPASIGSLPSMGPHLR